MVEEYFNKKVDNVLLPISVKWGSRVINKVYIVRFNSMFFIFLCYNLTI